MPCKRPENPEDLDLVTALVNEAATDDTTEISYSNHALERMGLRQINPESTVRVLAEGCAVSVRIDERGGRKRYRYAFHWSDRYGWLRVVVQITRNGALRIVTVIRDI